MSQQDFFDLEAAAKILLYHAVTGELGQPVRVLLPELKLGLFAGVEVFLREVRVLLPELKLGLFAGVEGFLREVAASRVGAVRAVFTHVPGV